MYKSTFVNLLIHLGLYLMTLGAYAQPDTENILFEQNFAEPGFPSGWTTNDLSGQDVIWSWCADPTTGPINGCPKIWTGGTNNQLPFAATTAENGFLTLNSDAYPGINQPHISQLTSPAFDLSTQDTVWIKFETHLGVFNLTPNSNAILRVSNNGGTSWEIFNCFPEFPLAVGTVDNRWSANPKTIYFDVSAVAAFQSSVIFQWQWKGREEYHWSIDDVQVSGSDPRPETDLVLRKKTFLIPENAIIPNFEIAPVTFGAKIANQGSQPQLETKLAIAIFNNNEFIYSDTIVNETINVDEESDLLLFENTFTPPNTSAVYQGIYTILPDSPDATPENNQQNFSFEISENTIAKERQITPRRSTAPLDSEWMPSEPHSRTWGNYFFVHNGQDKLAAAATFSIANAEVLGGKSVSLTLFEWTDLDNSKTAEPSERNLIAFGQYDITGSEPGDGFITVPLVAFPGTAALQNNQGYLLMLEYFAEDETDLFINYSDEQDYETTLNHQESLGTNRYASMLGIGNPLGEVTYSSLAFGFDRIPMVRLEMDDIVGVEQVLPAAFQIEISPNPTAGDIQIQFDFPETTPTVLLNLYNQSGKLLRTKSMTTVQNERGIVAGNNLAAGIYFLEIITELGRRTMRVVKVR